MNKVAFLVTARMIDLSIPYGDGLKVVGVFSTKEKAQEMVDIYDENYEYEDEFIDFDYHITEMGFDLPYGNDEFKHYPESYYFE